MIYTFSPNWYKPQCLHFSQCYLYYCSNYLLYEYNLNQKRIEKQICFRQIAIQNHLNYKDIKISAINSTKEKLIIGINQPYLLILQKSTGKILDIKHIDQFQSIEYIHLYKQKQLEYVILCNKDGLLVKINMYQQLKYQQKIEIKHKLTGIKAIYQIQNHQFIIFTRGTIIVYSYNFQKIQKVIQISNNDAIFSIDQYKQGNKIYFSFLTRSKDNYQMTIFQYCFKQQFPLQFKKKINQIATNIKNININFNYPKKYSQKLKNSQKASLSIKMINFSQIIITGKFGQICTLNLDKIKNQQKLVISPYSYQQKQQNQYSIWQNSRHYKQIYYIYQHNQRLYIISTDHNLTIWNKQQNNIKYIYSIKFLTSSVNNFFYSQCDPINIYALLKDSAIRSFTPLEQGNHQINQYWKFSKKYKIKKSICHPLEEGVLCLTTQCNKIQIYDVLEDRLMKLIQINQQIINVTFQYPQIYHEIQTMLKRQFKNQKINYISHFIKQMQNKTILLVLTKNSIIFINNLAFKQIQFFKCPRDKRFQRIHQNRYWDRHLLLASQSKGEDLTLTIQFNTKLFSQTIKLPYQQGRVMFKYPKNSSTLSIMNFKVTKFSFLKYTISEEQEKLIFIFKFQIIFQSPIDYLNINYFDQRISIYTQRDDMLAIVNCNNIQQQKIQIKNSTKGILLYSMQSKLQTMCFYLQNHIILATKDQTIKVVNINQLQQYKWKKQNKFDKILQIKDKQPNIKQVINQNIQKFQQFK